MIGKSFILILKMETHLRIMECLYHSPAAIDSECAAHYASLVLSVPNHQVSHSLEQCVESHVTILLGKRHVSSYQIALSEETQWLLKWSA